MSGSRQPPSALGARAEREDLGMRGRVAAQLALVRRGREGLAVAGDDGADRDVVVAGSRRRGGQRQPHQLLVAHQSFVAAITIDAARQTTRITIATVQERGIGQA